MVIDTQVGQIISGAVDIGHDTVYKMMSKAIADQNANIETEGLGKVLKEIKEGNTKMLQQLGENREKQTTALFQGIGGVVGEVGNAFMKNALIGVAGAVAVPLITSASGIPGPVKIILIVVIAYFVAAYFFKFWPFNQRENKMMSIMFRKGPRYILKRRKNKSPYGGLQALPVGGVFRT